MIPENGRLSDVDSAAGVAGDGRPCRGDCGADAAADSKALTAPLESHALHGHGHVDCAGHESRQSNLKGNVTMSLLIDLVLELLAAGGIESSTDRGLVATFTFGSIALVSVCIWLLMTSPEPLKQPAWDWASTLAPLWLALVGLWCQYCICSETRRIAPLRCCVWQSTVQRSRFRRSGSSFDDVSTIG
jgi:hypothetical protein